MTRLRCFLYSFNFLLVEQRIWLWSPVQYSGTGVFKEEQTERGCQKRITKILYGLQGLVWAGLNRVLEELQAADFGYTTYCCSWDRLSGVTGTYEVESHHLASLRRPYASVQYISMYIQ